MHFKRPHRSHEHCRRGFKSGLAAFYVKEFLGAEIRAEARFRDHVVGKLSPARVAITELQPWAMLANGPP